MRSINVVFRQPEDVLLPMVRAVVANPSDLNTGATVSSYVMACGGLVKISSKVLMKMDSAMVIE